MNSSCRIKLFDNLQFKLHTILLHQNIKYSIVILNPVENFFGLIFLKHHV